MVGNSGEKVEVQPLRYQSDAEICARMMAESEPWITLKRDYPTSLQIISDSNREVYLAILDNKIVGFVILVMHGALTGYIQSIYTHPEWRGLGIGNMLMDFVEKRVFRETPNVFIMVSSFNPDAKRLYLRRGYKVIGELKEYIISGTAEILLRKTIGPLQPGD